MDRSRYVKAGSNPLKSLQDVLGFRKSHSLLLWIILGGTITRFVLTRTTSLNVDRVLCRRAAPGECFFWQASNISGLAGIILHLATVLPASLLAFLQFVPILRRKAMAFHRVNGYVVLLLSVVGMISGVILSKDAFGGTLELQSAMMTTAILFAVCMGLSMWNIKRLRIDQHRAWMLRAWAVAFNAVTMRFVSKVLVPLASVSSGTRFVVRSCAAVDYMFGGNITIVESVYPSCEEFYSGFQPDQHVLIQGNITSTRVDHIAANLGIACASSAWLALVLHCIAVEVYLALTPGESDRLKRVSRQRQQEVMLGNNGLKGDTMDEDSP